MEHLGMSVEEAQCKELTSAAILFLSLFLSVNSRGAERVSLCILRHYHSGCRMYLL